jgi:hypothetical protein
MIDKPFDIGFFDEPHRDGGLAQALPRRPVVMQCFIELDFVEQMCFEHNLAERLGGFKMGVVFSELHGIFFLEIFTFMQPRIIDPAVNQIIARMIFFEEVLDLKSDFNELKDDAIPKLRLLTMAMDNPMSAISVKRPALSLALMCPFCLSWTE